MSKTVPRFFERVSSVSNINLCHFVLNCNFYLWLWFLSFRNEDSIDDEAKYLEDARNLIKPERNSLTVAFPDIQDYNQNLATVVTEDYYRYQNYICYDFEILITIYHARQCSASIVCPVCRVYPYLCRGLKNFLKDEAEINIPSKEFYVAFNDVPTRLKVRELSTAKIGTLIRISGQVSTLCLSQASILIIYSIIFYNGICFLLVGCTYSSSASGTRVWNIYLFRLPNCGKKCWTAI